MTLSTPPLADTPLGRTISETPTDIWNDSCAIEELQYAVDFGAVGATANPTIVVDNWRKDESAWASRVRALATENPTWTERDIAWAVVAEMSVRAAPLLLPAFRASGGRAGGSRSRPIPPSTGTPTRWWSRPSDSPRWRRTSS